MIEEMWCCDDIEWMFSMIEEVGCCENIEWAT